jgi:hypothetical protein
MKGIIGNSTWGTSCHKTACVDGLKEVYCRFEHNVRKPQP